MNESTSSVDAVTGVAVGGDEPGALASTACVNSESPGDAAERADRDQRREAERAAPRRAAAASRNRAPPDLLDAGLHRLDRRLAVGSRRVRAVSRGCVSSWMLRHEPLRPDEQPGADAAEREREAAPLGLRVAAAPRTRRTARAPRRSRRANEQRDDALGALHVFVPVSREHEDEDAEPDDDGDESLGDRADAAELKPALVAVVAEPQQVAQRASRRRAGRSSRSPNLGITPGPMRIASPISVASAG